MPEVQQPLVGYAKAILYSRKRKRRIAKARKLGTHTHSEWLEMLAFFDWRCAKCDKQCHKERRPKSLRKTFTICKDHIIPLCCEGESSDSITNIQPLCFPCSSSKGPGDTDYRSRFANAPVKWFK